MKILILDIVMAAGMIIALLLSSFSEFSQQCEDVQYSVLRLHIPANSDSEEDQQLKLELRDMLLTRYGEQLSECSSVDEAYAQTEALLSEINIAADNFLAEKGADYNATAELVNMYFPTREYENVTLPAGYYDALRVTLGSGKGHNWWCVMYPSLCLSAVSKELPTELLNEKDNALYPFISGNQTQIEVRFALFEVFKRILK